MPSPANILPSDVSDLTFQTFSIAPPGFNVLITLPTPSKRIMLVTYDATILQVVMSFEPLPNNILTGATFDHGNPGQYQAINLLNRFPRHQAITFKNVISQFYLSWSIGGSPFSFSLGFGGTEDQTLVA